MVFTDDRERAVAIGIWTAAHSVGATIGPLVGGIVTERWGWGAVFLINVPVIVVILAVGAKVIPESRNPLPRRWDVASVALSVTGLAGVVYALKQAGEHAGVDGVILATAAGGAPPAVRLRPPPAPHPRTPAGLLPVPRAPVHHRDPLRDRLLRQLRGAAVLPHSVAPAGRRLLPAARRSRASCRLAGANAVGAVTAPWAANRWGNRWALTAALALFAAAMAVIALTGDTGRYGALLVPLLCAGYGAGIVMTLGADSIMSAAQPERSGEAAAIQETSFELGSGPRRRRPRHRTDRRLPHRPALRPRPRRRRAGHRREVLRGGGGAGPRTCPPRTADALLQAGRHAYDRGFTAVTTIAALGLAGTALLAALMLRPARPTSDPPAGGLSPPGRVARQTWRSCTYPGGTTGRPPTRHPHRGSRRRRRPVPPPRSSGGHRRHR